MENTVYYVSRDPIDQRDFIVLCKKLGFEPVAIESVYQLRGLNAPVVYQLGQMMADERHWVLGRLAQPGQRRPTVLLVAQYDLDLGVLQQVRGNGALVAVGLFEAALIVAAAVQAETAGRRRVAA